MLSRETTDQIRKEAEEKAGPYTNDMYENSDNQKWFNARSCEKDFIGGYEAGATAWAVWKQKADVFEKALKEISKLELHDNLLSRDLLYNCIGIATKALESFNQNKVK